MTSGTRTFFWASAALWATMCATAWGPLRIPSPPLAAGLALLALVVLPGVLFARVLGLPERDPLSAIPVGFLLGLGLWSVPAVVTTTYVHGSLESLLRLVAGGTAALLVVALLLERRRPVAAAAAGPLAAAPSQRAATLVYAAAAAATVFALTALVAWRGEALANNDRLSYLAFLRHFLESDAIFTRGFILGPDTQLSGRDLFQPWLVVIALVVRVARVDLLDAYTLLLPLLLVPLACLGLLLFARELFGDRRGGLLALPALALVTLSVYSNSFALGFLGRLIEDKFLLRHALLPVSLWLALRFLRTGRRCYLAGLAAGAVGIVLVHPLGIVFLGLALGPFLLLSLLLERAPGRAARALWLLALLALLLPIPLWERQLVAAAAADTTHLTFSLENGLSGPLAAIRESRLLVFPGGRYIVSPSLVSAPLLLLSLALTPLLLPALRRLDSARFLFASTAAALLICFSPLTPLFGAAMTPWMLWRVLWLVPAPLLITFFALRASGAPEQGGGSPSLTRQLAPLGVLLVAGLLFAGDIARTLRQLERARGNVPSADARAVLRHLHDTAAPGSLILTPDRYLDAEIPGFVGHAYGITFRWLDTAGARKERAAFFAADALGVRGLAFLERRRIAHVVVGEGTRLAAAFRALPRQFAPRYANGTYAVFERRATPPDPAERAILEEQDVAADNRPAKTARRPPRRQVPRREERRRPTVDEWLKPRFDRVVTRLWGPQAAGSGRAEWW